MAETSSEWSSETYRLDEIPERFQFPLLVQVTEGVLGDNEEETFSAGDVIMIDECIELQKVVAQFVFELEKAAASNEKHENLREEILIPLNYDRKLKVQTDIRTYECVRELADALPRYAKVLENFTAPMARGERLEISEGTTLELDRIIPGMRAGKLDHLVANVDTEKHNQLAIPLNKTYKFRAVADRNEYTLKTVIERYSLPQIIRFQEVQQHEVNPQDMFDLAEQMVTVGTSALQIMRLVKRKVLLGHFSAMSQPTNESETSFKSTPIVVPLDSVDLREILVKVHNGDTNGTIYRKLTVRNAAEKRKTAKFAEEGFYLEFANRPRIVRLQENQTKKEAEREPRTDRDFLLPPALPPKPGTSPKNAGRRLPPIPPGMKPQPESPYSPPHVYKNERFARGRNDPKKTEDDNDYVLPSPPKSKSSSPLLLPKKVLKKQKSHKKTSKPPTAVISPTTEFSLADLDFNTIGNEVHHEKKHIWSFGKKKKDKKKKKDDTLTEPQTSGLSSVVTPIPDLNRSNDNIDNGYCEVDDWLKPNGQHKDHVHESEQGNNKLIGNKPQTVTEAEDSSLDCESNSSFRVTVANAAVSTTNGNNFERYTKVERKPTPLSDQGLPFPDPNKVKEMDVVGRPKGVILNVALKPPNMDNLEVDLAKISAPLKGQDQNARMNTRKIMIKPKYTAKNKTGELQGSENSLSTNKIEISGEIKNKEKVAQVLPCVSSNRPQSMTKEFHLLTVNELNERLKICGMEDFAVFCSREKINGAFLSNMDDETVSAMELSKFHVQKLKQIMTGWVPR